MKPPRPVLAATALALAATVLALDVISAPANAQAPATVNPAAWRQAAPGLEASVRSAGGALVVLVRADPASTTLRVVRAEPGAPLTAAGLAQRDGALAVINGSFFDEGGAPIGWIVSDGRTLAPPARAGWGAFTVRNGKPRIVPMTERMDPADQALQAGPRLVIDGKPNPGLKAQTARRAFVGVDARGRVILGATGPTSVEASDLAAFLAKPESDGGLGLVAALNLDGGSSAQLHARDDSGDPIDLAGIPVPVLLEVLPKAK